MPGRYDARCRPGPLFVASAGGSPAPGNLARFAARSHVHVAVVERFMLF
jgi:hypothetical protein